VLLLQNHNSAARFAFTLRRAVIKALGAPLASQQSG